MSKLPAFQFYPADWRKDPGVQSLTFFDRGVWFEILCLMHESEQRGKLLLAGKPMPDEALSRLLGLDKQGLSRALNTLIEYGVAERDKDGTLVNRRMVRDEALRKIRTECGKLGGNPVLLNQEDNQTPKQNLTPSSSSSSSSSPSIKRADVKKVFEEWQRILNHPKARLDKSRTSKIKARLIDGFTPEELCRVPHGVRRSRWHMGENPEGKKYDDIATIFRDAAQVEKFLAADRIPEPTVSKFPVDMSQLYKQHNESL